MITCSICGQAKPTDQFYPDPARFTGYSSRCKPCDNGRHRQTGARIIRNRARQRATQALVAEHAERFHELYSHALEMAKDEAEMLAAQPSEHSGPVRLRPGKYAEGDEALDRIAAERAGCEHCADAHTAGHVCPACGSTPLTATEQARLEFLEDVQWIIDSGETDAEVIAQRVRMERESMLRRLYRYERNDLIERMDRTGHERVGAA